MKNSLLKSVALLILLPFFGNAQEKKEEPKYGISLSGYVKSDFIFDSRQTINLREGHFLIYPDNIKKDKNDEDINAVPNLSFLSIQSRLHADISGPNVLGAKASGMFEAEFFGHSDADINGFRLRHATIKLKWKTTELLVGQYWHPMFVTDCFSDVVSFNTGAPFQPFTRNPQIRLTQNIGKFKIIAALLEQRDFQSTGPDGGSSKYLRNSAIPDAHLQIQFNLKNEDKGTDFLIGVGGGYKFLKPRLSNDIMSKATYTLNTPSLDTNTWTITYKPAAVIEKYQLTNKIGSYSVIGFAKLKTKPVTVKIEGVYGQNLYDMTMLGGYAVSDSTKDNIEYTPISTLSAWVDIQTNGKLIQFGVFGGYSKNMGADEVITGSNYSRGANIAYLIRVSPRIVVNIEKFRIGLEMEYTGAAYGLYDQAARAAKGDVKDDINLVNNFRGLLAFSFFF